MTILTHYWARERCNDYYIARSQDRTVTDCPLGPWVLQRAYHRNPYKGAQRCDECIKASRKDAKRVQQVRQKNNMAHGERREYSGALNVGELVIPDDFQNTPQPLFRGQPDVDKSSWENFALANAHLSSHELEREWANRFAQSNVGVGFQSMTNASTVRQQINGEDSYPRMALVETNYRRLYQPVQHHPQNNIYKGKPTVGEDNSQYISPYTKSTQHEPKHMKLAAATPQSSFQEIRHSNYLTSNQKPDTTVQGQASEGTHRTAQHQRNLPLRASSSQSTRARPWEM